MWMIRAQQLRIQVCLAYESCTTDRHRMSHVFRIYPVFSLRRPFVPFCAVPCRLMPACPCRMELVGWGKPASGKVARRQARQNNTRGHTGWRRTRGLRYAEGFTSHSESFSILQFGGWKGLSEAICRTWFSVRECRCAGWDNLIVSKHTPTGAGRKGAATGTAERGGNASVFTSFPSWATICTERSSAVCVPASNAAIRREAGKRGSDWRTG